MATVPKMHETAVGQTPLRMGWEPDAAESRRQTIQAELLAAAQDYQLQGNVVRLQSALSNLQRLCRQDLAVTAGHTDPAASSVPAALIPLSQVIQKHIVQVYRAVGCNKTRAARVLEIDIKTLYTKLKRFGQQ